MEQTDPRHLLINIAKILKRLKVPYLVTGGIAVLVWGRPRFTADIDIVVEFKEKDVDLLAKELMALGRAGYVDKDLMRNALRSEGEFNFIDGETGVKVDFWILKSSEFDLSKIKRKIEKEILGEKVYFSSPEDLILSKLVWHKKNESFKQLEDVESVLKISGEKLDMKYLNNWAEKLMVADVLNKLM